MDKLKMYREKIAEIDKRLSEIATTVEKESRGRTEDEKAEWVKLKADKDEFRDLISELEKMENEERKNPVTTTVGTGAENESEVREKAKLAKQFSFTRLVQNALSRTGGGGESLDGVEKEMHEEARKEARGLSGGISGYGVPSWMVDYGKRDLTVGSATSAGNLVATDLSTELIPALRPNLAVVRSGARVFTGLTSNFDISRKTGETAMTWEGENDANAEGTPTTDKLQIRPNRGGVTVDISKQLILQSSFGVEQMVRDDITFAIQKGVDYAAIAGAGSGNQPRGILNTVGIGSVSMGTPDGGAPTYAKLQELIREVAVDDALMGTLGFMGNPKVAYKLSVTPRQSSGVEGNFIMTDPNTLLGYRYLNSTQVPSNLSEGGSGAVLSALIFGNFNELMLFQFGGLDIVIDPYSKKTTALVEMTINSWWDVAVRHVQSFAAAQDVVTA